MEILTKVTKKHKIDGVLKILNLKKENHQVIGIAEFSKGIKSSDTKDVNDKVKLGHNAMRIIDATQINLCIPNVQIPNVDQIPVLALLTNKHPA